MAGFVQGGGVAKAALTFPKFFLEIVKYIFYMFPLLSEKPQTVMNSSRVRSRRHESFRGCAGTAVAAVTSLISTASEYRCQLASALDSPDPILHPGSYSYTLYRF